MWWALRGAVIGGALWFVTLMLMFPTRPLSWIGVQDLYLPTLVAIAAMVLSVEAGRRKWLDLVGPRPFRWGVRIAEALVVLAVLPIAGSAVASSALETWRSREDAQLARLAEQASWEASQSGGSGTGSTAGLVYNGRRAFNVFPYGPDGLPVDGIRLVTDSGQIIDLDQGGFPVTRDGTSSWLYYGTRADSPYAPFGVFPLKEVLAAEPGQTAGLAATDAPLPRDSLAPLESGPSGP
jgi:hypothetical protein